jgi:ferritin-like metal-binding protein YciE
MSGVAGVLNRKPRRSSEREMSETKERDAKLIQYLNEAYGKEKELEAALETHIGMTSRMPYKKRLRKHLTETKDHSRKLERRIKALGGGGQALQTVTAKALATAKGPLHALRGTSEQERMLKNAKTEYSEEHEEIATYTAIEVFADKVGDPETAKVAREIRRDEERMAAFLERLIPQLTRSVVTESVPAAQRNAGRGRRSTSRKPAQRRSSRGSSGSRSAGSTRGQRRSSSGNRRKTRSRR